MKRFIASAFLTLASVAAFAQAEYRLVDLGMLPGNTYSTGLAINNHGRVAGYSFTPDGINPNQAFLSTQSGKRLIALGTLGGEGSAAYAVNDRGQVTGQARIAGGLGITSHAFFFDNGQMTDLGTLGGSDSVGAGINAKGHVVGTSLIKGSDEYQGFLYRDGKMTRLGTLGGGYSAPADINDAGQIAGFSGTADGLDHAFLYTDGTMRDLGTLGGAYSTARAINNDGQVVGQSVTADGQYHAFVYRNKRMLDLGTLGGDSSGAEGINSQGWIVGSSDISFAQPRAFIYRNGKMEDLNTLLDADSATGWVLQAANAINDANEITGTGQYKGVLRAFVIKPL
jgi:probable HAF family extracellular repeat protein